MSLSIAYVHFTMVVYKWLLCSHFPLNRKAPSFYNTTEENKNRKNLKAEFKLLCHFPVLKLTNNLNLKCILEINVATTCKVMYINSNVKALKYFEE